MLSCQQRQVQKNSLYKHVDTKTNISEQTTRTSMTPSENTVQMRVVLESKASELTSAALQTGTILEKQNQYMTVTAYCPCAKCCGWKMNRYGNPVYNYGPKRGHSKEIGITSTGTKADIGTIAANTRSVPYGTRLYIPGYGYGEVKDTGGLLKKNHIDLFFHSHSEAMEWGIKYLEVGVWPPE
jgi:3D (Asp-Asp-Asp) domain-containing protein